MQEFFEPSTSVWINASAGNGKTKILIDRVLRLILNTSQFSKILCITFTKSAALEIEKRILNKILQWSKKSLNEIRLDIETTYNYSPSTKELKRAQGLYLQYLNTAEKLNIHTIHSFCQKILSLFLIENQSNNNLQLASEYNKTEILNNIKRELILSKDFEHLTKYIVENMSEFQVKILLEEILNKKSFIQNTKRECSPSEIEDLLQKKIDINKKYNIKSQKFLEDNILKIYIPNPDINIFKSLFFTKLNKKKTLSFKMFQTNRAYLKKLQQEFIELEQEKATQILILHSQIISLFLLKALKLYEDTKKLLGLLDYEDLIIKLSELLKMPSIKNWILYKMDNLIDHILIDEAQDTNPLQWEIIDNLIQEIYSNYNYKNTIEHKSIFIVGDIKQSIFSFQSVDLNYYLNFVKKLEQDFNSANHKFISREFFTSYRSAKEINDFVYEVFSYISTTYPEIAMPISKIDTKKNFEGTIEVWPLYKHSENKFNAWPIITNENLETFIEQKFLNLADDICKFIKEKLDSGYILKSEKRAIKASDFLILCRKRSKLTEVLQNRCIKRGIKLSSFGKIYLKENIIGQDFISIAKFILNPYDELNLASMLKSPLVNLSERNLQEIILTKNKEQNLWDCIQDHNLENLKILELKITISNKLLKLKQDYKNYSSNNMFLFLSDILNLRELYYKIFDSIKVDHIMNELITVNNEYIQNQNFSLMHFINWIENNDVKLDIDNNIMDESVKLMTIHSAKGLEAPIVILCDVNNVPQNNKNIFYQKDGSMFIKGAGINSEISPLYEEIKKKEKKLMLQEYLRLLYVALTRAAEFLVICDVEHNINSQFSWFNLIIQSTSKMNCKNEQGKLIIKKNKNNFI